jgi:hypothetical protein
MSREREREREARQESPGNLQSIGFYDSTARLEDQLEVGELLGLWWNAKLELPSKYLPSLELKGPSLENLSPRGAFNDTKAPSPFFIGPH